MQRASGLYGLALNFNGAVELSIRRLPTTTVVGVIPPRHPGKPTEIYQYIPDSSHTDPQRLDPRTARQPIQFLTSLLTDLVERDEGTVTSLKLIVPKTGGYVARNDVFERRLEGCKSVLYAQSFVQPLQRIQPPPNGTDFANLSGLLLCVLGGIVIRESDATDINTVPELADAELTNRLSHSWILPEPLFRKRLAVVCGRSNYANSARIWATAAALGIDLVVLDAADHWLQQPEHISLREACVPTDITIDAGVVARVVAAVRAYPRPIDGIVTFESAYLLVVAQAAQALQLSTNDPDAVAVSCDKARTRTLEPSAAESFECSSVAQLRARLHDLDAPPLRFPVIVKPCMGWSSERVARADDADALAIAVTTAIRPTATDTDYARAACVVEPYIDGPEFDANFVLLDGQILFSDISDDYPSVSDAVNASVPCNFLETQIVLPSRLPETEQALIRVEMLASILRQGFTDGIFHCEGRVRDSSVAFQRSATGYPALAPREGSEEGNASVYLIENNARAPAYMESVLVEMIYGVDFYAQQMLHALGPSERSRFLALAEPFKNGPAFHGLAQFIGAKESGPVVFEDSKDDLLRRVPRLAELDHALVAYWGKKKGDWVNGPETGVGGFLAWYAIVSRTGLEDLLDIGAEIEKRYAGGV